MYLALSAYGIANEQLEFSLTISELIKDAITEHVEGKFVEINGKQCINNRQVLSVLKLAGLRVPAYYYYRWCIEEIKEGEV